MSYAYFKLDSLSQAEALQKVLFNRGMWWPGGERIVRPVITPWLLINYEGMLLAVNVQPAGEPSKFDGIVAQIKYIE